MWFIALRQMLARKKQTLLTLIGIILGSMAYVIISGVLLGLRIYLIDQLINNDAQVKISSKIKIIKEHDLDNIFFPEKELPGWVSIPSGRRDTQQIENQVGWIHRISNDPDVLAYSPQLHIKAFFQRGQIRESGKIIGIDPGLHKHVVNFKDSIIQGDFEEIAKGGNKIILGEGLRSLLGASINDSILITGTHMNTEKYKIVAIFQMGNKAVDDSVAYLNLRDAQSLNQTTNRISDIAIRLKNVGDSLRKAEEWRKFSDVRVQSWEEINSTFISLFKMQDVIRYALVSTILLVASFGIYNILNMVISQKKREIAILRSIGFEAFDILQIFLLQGILLGITGGILGPLLGFLVCMRLENVSFSNPLMQTKSGLMSISYDPTIYIQAFFMAFISTLIASIIPAKQASNLSPIEIIRGE